MANDIYSDNLSLDEIVFENRNKEYGAYNLRHIYRKILTRSFIWGTVIFVVAIISPFIYLTIKRVLAPPQQAVKAELVEIIQEDRILPEEEKEEEPPPKQEEPPKQEIIKNVVPEPAKAPKQEEPPPKISEQVETTTGLVKQEGVRNVEYTPPPPPPSTGKSNTAEVKVDTKNVYESVDQKAEYPGGINAFRNKFGSMFDTDAIGDVAKGEVVFVVEINGTITDIKVTSSNPDFVKEAIRTINSIKTKWKPAKLDGQEVRSRFRMPVSIAPPE
ncbi:MAG: energy transducer TonB [Flavobacteriaceae bacterium]|jgi:protein TonB|nr:energy transducer TonB [Flavobacteriaceae bacterium]